MRKTKKWLTAAAWLVGVGCLLFVLAMTLKGWDFTKLSTVYFETETHAVSEPFSNIRLETRTADIVIVPSEDDMCRVICHEPEDDKYTVSVRNDTLVISEADERKWYEHIGIVFETTDVRVELPMGEYGALTIDGTTGDIDISEDFRFDCADISLTTGDIRLSGIGCRELNVQSTTGETVFENVIVDGTLAVEKSTGSVILTDADAGEIVIDTSTGDVRGTVLSEKVFDVQTSTGSVDVPQSGSGGKCRIRTSTGDIKIKVKN